MVDISQDLQFSEIRSGLDLASYIDGPVEVKVVRLAAGTEIPLHSHSNNVIHLIVRGKIQLGDTVFEPLGDYRCGSWEYRGIAIEDSVMLIIQPPGTDFKFVE